MKRFDYLGGVIGACVMIGAAAAQAENYVLRSAVTSATVYPSGALIEREANLAVPAGQHRLTFRDVPAEFDADEIMGLLQTKVTGGRLGPISTRIVAVSEAEIYSAPNVQAAKETLQAAEEALAVKEEAAARISVEINAAEDLLDYLARTNADKTDSVAERVEIARMIAAESASARQSIISAQAALRALEPELALLEADVATAEAALAQLVSENANRIEIVLDVTAPEAADLEVAFSYVTQQAGWQPSYTAALDTGANAMTLTRGIQAWQGTGEAWVDVALAFSTEDAKKRVAPTELHPWIRRIFDPASVMPRALGAAKHERSEMVVEQSLSADDFEGVAPMMEVATEAVADISGLNLTYHYPENVIFYSGAGGTEFALSELTFDTDIHVRAVPARDAVGYVMASFENSSGEVFVPGELRLIRDGSYLNSTYLPTIARGEEVEVPFGALEGMKLSRVVKDRSEGDRGVISKSNEAETQVVLKIENLTGLAWPLEVLERVSVSEQEDLDVTWAATPVPSEERFEERRGVLAWRFDLDAGDTQEISITETLRWPEGMVLR